MDTFNVYRLRIMISNDSNSGKTYDFYVDNPDEPEKNLYLSSINVGDTAFISGKFYDIETVK